MLLHLSRVKRGVKHGQGKRKRRHHV
jgi:hypothetical protein